MRALIASFGASAALVAGAAVALLFVSLLVGYDGFSGYLDGSTQQSAIRVVAADASTSAGKRSRAPAPIIVAAPRPPALKPAAPVARQHASQGVRTGSAVEHTPAPSTSGSAGNVAAPPAAPKATPKPKPTVGDGVRRLGDDISSTVQRTGDATGAVTKLLGPPVSAAVQKVIDLISSLLKKTTGALGSTADTVLAPQR